MGVSDEQQPTLNSVVGPSTGAVEGVAGAANAPGASRPVLTTASTAVSAVRFIS